MGERRLHARHRIGGVGELLARARPVDQRAVLDQDDIGGPLEVAPLTFGWRTEEAQQRFKFPFGDGGSRAALVRSRRASCRSGLAKVSGL